MLMRRFPNTLIRMGADYVVYDVWTGSGWDAPGTERDDYHSDIIRREVWLALLTGAVRGPDTALESSRLLTVRLLVSTLRSLREADFLGITLLGNQPTRRLTHVLSQRSSSWRSRVRAAHNLPSFPLRLRLLSGATAPPVKDSESLAISLHIRDCARDSKTLRCHSRIIA
jgi:hypothetical protein